MIARIFIPVLIIIVLSEVYLDVHFLRHRFHYSWRKRLLWLTPGILMAVYTILLSTIKNFVPDDLKWITFYLALLGLLVTPKFLFAVCSFLGLIVRKIFHMKRNYGNLLGLLLAVWGVYIIFAGYTYGFRQLEVKHVDLSFSDLPKQFDGYRITLISDIHAGTFSVNRSHLLSRDIDSVNAQKSDVILFVGDLENIKPQELYPFRNMLTRLHAADGVYSVLGNHDYSGYVKVSPQTAYANEQELIRLQQEFGWHLLRNEHHVIHRGNDSIVIAGGENDGVAPFPHKADLERTLRGLSKSSFVIMMQHDPQSWRSSILPSSHCQLTLSGHTHGGQFSVLGWRPTSYWINEDYGLYEQDGRYLYVTAGLGGLIPYRYNMPAEIVVITLHSKR